MSVFSVPVTIGVDEEKIAREIHKTVESQIVDEIKGIIYSTNYYGKVDEKDHTPLRNMVEREVKNVMSDKEDIIIQKAAEVLADKMYRSKACKEAMKETIEKNK